MKKSFGDYRCLGSRKGLWEGPDHLLYIESSGFILPFSESYRRIDYAKIQSLTYGRSRTWGWTLAWQCLLLGLSVWGLTASFQSWRVELDGGSAFLAIVCAAGALFSGIPLIINLIRGPTCICKVQTAVQVLRLKPVRRMREARRLAERLATLCVGHQGGSVVNAEQLAGLAQAAPGPGPLYMKGPFTGSSLISWTMVLLLCAGGFTSAELFVDSLAFFLVDVLLILSSGCMVTISLVRSTRFELPGALKGALWGGLANFIFSLVVGFGLYVYANVVVMQEALTRITLKMGGTNNSPVALASWLSHASFKELDWAAWLVISIGGLNLFLALLGLPSAMRPSARVAVTAPPPASPVRQSVPMTIQPDAIVTPAAPLEPEPPSQEP